MGDTLVRGEKGFSTIEFIIGAIVMTFVMFFPIVSLFQMNQLDLMEQELNRTLQMAAVKGAVTTDVQQATKDDLSGRGISQIAFTSNTTTSPLPRGNIIHVGIQAKRSDQSLFRSVMKLIGGGGSAKDTFTVQGSIMSEYIK